MQGEGGTPQGQGPHAQEKNTRKRQKTIIKKLLQNGPAKLVSYRINLARFCYYLFF